MRAPVLQRTNRHAGTIEIGVPNRIATTRLVGALVQTPSGHTVIDLAPFVPGVGPQADRIDVTGHAQLAGQVQVRLQGSAGAAPNTGGKRVTLVSATDGVDFTGLSVTQSAVARYRLESGSLLLSYDVNFANPDTVPSLNAVQRDVASYLEGLHFANAFPGDLNYLVGLATAQEYGQALESYSPEVYGTNLWTTALAATEFNEGLLDCRNRAGGRRVLSDSTCLAIGAQGWQFGRDASSSGIGYSTSAAQFGIAAQRQLPSQWTIGAAFGYGNTITRSDGNLWSARTNLYELGVTAGRGFGNFSLTASAIGGFGQPDVRRTTATTVARGTQDVHYFGGTLRAEQAFSAPQGTLRLRADLTVLHLGSGSLSESGGFGRLDVAASSMTDVSLTPAVEWSNTMPLGARYLLTPRISLGITQFLTDPSPVTVAAFSGLGASAPPIRVSSHVASTYGDIHLGLEVAGPGGLSVGASVFGRASGSSSQIGGGLQFSQAF